MFAAIGRLSLRYRWAVIAVWVVFLVAAVPLVPSVASALRPGGFASEDLESRQALTLMSDRLGVSLSSVQVFFTSETLTADDPAFLARTEAATARLREWSVVSAVVPYVANPAQVSRDRRAVYSTIVLSKAAEDVPDLAEEVRARLVPQPDLRTVLGGGPLFYVDIQKVSEADLRRAELIAIPFAAIALLLVFRSPVAALLPAVVGGVAATIALALIALLAQVTPLSIFVLNVATLFGLGLGVDYALFILSRFREELDRYETVDEAVIASVATAGRAVFFSGLTVTIGLGALILFRFNILRSVGIGGVLVVVLALLAALTLLPAVLSILGRRVNAWSIPLPALGRGGFWQRLALGVMRRPVLVLLPTLALLIGLGAPFLSVRLGAPDASILPASTPSREALDLLRTRFDENETTPIFVVLRTRQGQALDPANLNALARYVSRIQADSRVARVESLVSIDPRFTLDQYQLLYGDGGRLGDAFIRGSAASLAKDDVTIVRVVAKTPMLASESLDLVGALRNSRPAEFEALVTGGSAGVVDYVNVLYHDFPLAIAAIFAVTYLVLLVLFRSVLLPLKAIVMNTVSIIASYGALVVVFQDGFLSGPLGFTPLGFVEASIPVLMFCALFGLSMDYEVFLLSRIQEAYAQTGDNTRSVALGLERSGRIVSSAALIVVAVSLAFMTADMILVKAIGMGMAIAVALDATLVRGLLVPATMRLLGDANWWLPASLGRILPRIEHEETPFAEAT